MHEKNNRRKEETGNFGTKKELELLDCKEIEMYMTRNKTREFYQKVKHQTDGFCTGISPSKDSQWNLVTEKESVLRISKKHFYIFGYTHLLVLADHKAVYDSPIRTGFNQAISVLGVPAKLAGTTLTDTI